jgi:hypothetical protein
MNRGASKSHISISEGNRVKAIASILAVIGFALSGCSGPRHYWYNPEKTLSEARLDCRECYNQAVEEAAEDVADEYYRRSQEMQEAPPWSSQTDRWSGIEFEALDESTLKGLTHRENLFRGCMTSRGYTLTSEKDLDSNIRKSSLRAGKVAGR